MCIITIPFNSIRNHLSTPKMTGDSIFRFYDTSEVWGHSLARFLQFRICGTFGDDAVELSQNKKKAFKNTPCRTCISIRLFLLSVLGIIALSIIGTDSAYLLKGMSTMTVAIMFVGMLGCLAVGKSVIEIAQARRNEQS